MGARCSFVKQNHNSSYIEDRVSTCNGHLCQLHTITRKCYEKQLIVAYKLKELANELDKHQMTMTKVNVGFAAVGGALSAASFGLSFITFGASLILTILGATISAATGLSAVATSIAEEFITSKKIKEANAAILSYLKAVSEFAPELESFCECLTSVEERDQIRHILTDTETPSDSVSLEDVSNDGRLCETCNKAHSILAVASRVRALLESEGELGNNPSGKTKTEVARWSLGMLADVSSFGKGALKGTGFASNAIKIGGVAVLGVGVVIDVAAIIYYSIKAHNKQPSEVAELLRRIAEAFEQ